MKRLQLSPITFGKKDVEIITCETLYSGVFSVNLYRFRYRLFNGEISREVKREVFERKHAGALLPYDPVRDEVVLIEQLRIAAIDTSHSPWLLEVVAGIIEHGESIEDVCRRESKEEAGVNIKRCRPILSYLASPGGTSERLSIMIGEVNSAIAQGIHGAKGENENIRVHVINRKQAYHWIEEGVIDNAASVIALQWLELHYESLKKEWAS